MARIRITRPRGDDGVATAEYAVATVAACGFGGVLIKLLSSQPVMSMLVKAVTKALSFGF